jgi:hypothetical protein
MFLACSSGDLRSIVSYNKSLKRSLKDKWSPLAQSTFPFLADFEAPTAVVTDGIVH